jgi:hypothetical protein
MITQASASMGAASSTVAETLILSMILPTCGSEAALASVASM